MNDIIERLKRELELRAEEAPPAPNGGGAATRLARLFGRGGAERRERGDDDDDDVARAAEPEAWDVVRALPSGDARCVVPRAHGGHEAVDCCFADDDGGGSLATCGSDGAVTVWEGCDGLGAAPPRVRHCHARRDKDGGALAVALGGDGVVAAAFSSSRSVKLWDARSGKLRAEVCSAHGGAAKIRGLALAKRSRLLVTAASDRLVKFWDVTRAACAPMAPPALGARRAPSGALCLGLLSDDLVVSGHHDGCLRVWDYRSPEPAATIDAHDGSAVAGVAAHGRTSTLCSLGRDHSLRVFDARAASRLHVLNHDNLKVNSPTSRLAASPCGTYVAAPSATGDALVFDTTTGLLATLLAPPGLNTPPLAAVAWSQARTRVQLATVDKAGALALWD